MLRGQPSYYGLTIDGSLGEDVNSTSLLELDSDGDGDTPTYKNDNLSVKCQSNNDGSLD